MIHDLDAEAIIEVFKRCEVNYVVIGAFAAIAQNVPVAPTMDIDFYAAPHRLNLQRLSNALNLLDAKIRVNNLDEGIIFDRSPLFLGELQVLNLTCAHGEFDVLFKASGFQDFEELEKRSLTVVVGRTETQVASGEDLARSKRAAGRIKDLKVLHILERFLNDRDQGHGLEM